MATSTAATPDEHRAAARRPARERVRRARNRAVNLPAGYEEGMARMIGWYVLLETFPDTYNGRPLALAGLAGQKRYISLYLNSHGDRATEAGSERYRRLEEARHGKSCLRFTRADDIPLDLIGETIARANLDSFLAHYRTARGSSRRARRRSESPGHGRGADAFDAPNGVRTCLLAPLPSSAKFRQFLRRQIERRHSAGGSARRNLHCSSIELRSATPGRVTRIL